jgi:hypothetical protein
MYSDCVPRCFARHFDLVLIDCRYKTNGAEWDCKFLTAVTGDSRLAFWGISVLSALIKYTDVADEPAPVIIRVRLSTQVMKYQLT